MAMTLDKIISSSLSEISERIESVVQTLLNTRLKEYLIKFTSQFEGIGVVEVNAFLKTENISLVKERKVSKYQLFQTENKLSGAGEDWKKVKEDSERMTALEKEASAMTQTEYSELKKDAANASKARKRSSSKKVLKIRINGEEKVVNRLFVRNYWRWRVTDLEDKEEISEAWNVIKNDKKRFQNMSL